MRELKDDKMIVIKFYHKDPGDSNITINVEDKNTDNILKTIEALKTLKPNYTRNRILTIQYLDNDTIKEVTIDPWSIFTKERRRYGSLNIAREMLDGIL